MRISPSRPPTRSAATRPCSRGDLTAEGAPEALVQAAVRGVRADRHRGEQRRLHVGRHGAQDERRAVPRNARDPHRRALQGLRAAAPYLRDAGKTDKEAGREVFRKVVNVTSISGTQGNLGQVNYSAAKAGLVGLHEDARARVGAFKVNVNAVGVRVRRDATDRGVRRRRRDDRARRPRDPARNPREDAADGHR